MEIAEGIWVVKNFFTPEECQEWIDFAENIGFGDAPINVGFGAEKIVSNVRNNERAMIDDADKATHLWQKAKKHLPTTIQNREAIGLNERLRFYRYEQTQKFSWHFDGSFVRPNGEISLLTFMVYLNEDFQGGETVFVGSQRTEIVPKTGMMLAFNHRIFHEGSVVRSGKKYVLRSDVMFSA